MPFRLPSFELACHYFFWSPKLKTSHIFNIFFFSYPQVQPLMNALMNLHSCSPSGSAISTPESQFLLCTQVCGTTRLSIPDCVNLTPTFRLHLSLTHTLQLTNLVLKSWHKPYDELKIFHKFVATPPISEEWSLFTLPWDWSCLVTYLDQGNMGRRDIAISGPSLWEI